MIWARSVTRSRSALHNRALGNNGRPFRKRKVGGDEDRGFLCSLGNHLKQKFSTGFFERNIAHLVNGEKLPFLPAIQGATELSVALRFYEFIDQTGGRDKTGSPSLPAGLNTKGSHQMCFAGTGVAQKQNRFCSI